MKRIRTISLEETRLPFEFIGEEDARVIGFQPYGPNHSMAILIEETYYGLGAYPHPKRKLLIIDRMNEEPITERYGRYIGTIIGLGMNFSRHFFVYGEKDGIQN